MVAVSRQFRRGPWQFATALAVQGLVLLRTGAGTRREVKEAGNCTAELRRCRNRPRRINHDDKVRLTWHHKRIRHVRNRCAQAYNSGVAEIVQAQVRWIVAAEICSALDVPSAAERSIDRDGEARC